ncbi:MAG: hypothetical protein IJW83_02590 [Clostridia bacterium]|nr:hypothetical protein [Clostridia bacterium]
MPKKSAYRTDLPRRMYTFFLTYDESDSAPSFEKFARHVGTTVSELVRFRSHRVFDEAYRACQGLRRDYLIDRALTRRFDPSFVKFLLSAEGGDGTGQDDGSLNVTVEVVS